MDIYMISAFITYFVSLIGVGFWFYKKNQSASDFMLGNRTINYYVTAIATQASDMGSWLFLGFPSMVFIYGMFECWTAIGLIIGMWCSWTFVAPKLRERTAQLNSLTLSSYFAHSFDDKSGAIQILSSCFALLFFTFYIASGLVGLSLLFSSSFGISYEMGIVLSLLTAALYTLVGGFIAVAWCDFFQGLFLLAMIILVPATALYSVGGLNAIWHAAQLQDIPLSLIGSPEQTIWALFLAASWGLGYFGQPHILINFMGIKHPHHIKRARNIGITWQILVLSAAIAIGLVSIAFFQNGIANPQMIFITMTTQLFHPFFAGLILCAILAATLSTLDSLILVSGATIAQDLYKKCIRPHASSDHLVLISRIGSIAVCLMALALAWGNSLSIYNLVNYAWSGLGSTFGPLVLVSLYYKNITAIAALCGLIAGGTIAAIWPCYSPLLPLVPGFFGSLITIITVSCFTQD